eukprot:TRINITY_DN6243_c0_g1_i1.p1 TRINITY_DN6243_c0_g1~~TRINITY_DN6243_c0_g1_i1.p1  ORF type:complete len:299 (+),score=28.47 TRINITY_DN6243_c0_g1_i1:84-899(+)
MTRAESLKYFLQTNPDYVAPRSSVTVIVEDDSGSRNRRRQSGLIIDSIWDDIKDDNASNTNNTQQPVQYQQTQQSQSVNLIGKGANGVTNTVPSGLSYASVERSATASGSPSPAPAPSNKRFSLQRSDSKSGLWSTSVISINVSLQDTLVHPGETVPLLVTIKNSSKAVVKMVRVVLTQIDSTHEVDTLGFKNTKRRVTEVYEQSFLQGNKFPLHPHLDYTGEILFPIPVGIKPSEVSITGAYCREYFIAVVADAHRHKKPRVELPVTIQT